MDMFAVTAEGNYIWIAYTTHECTEIAIFASNSGETYFRARIADRLNQLHITFIRDILTIQGYARSTKERKSYEFNTYTGKLSLEVI